MATVLPLPNRRGPARCRAQGHGRPRRCGAPCAAPMPMACSNQPCGSSLVAINNLSQAVAVLAAALAGQVAGASTSSSAAGPEPASQHVMAPESHGATWAAAAAPTIGPVDEAAINEAAIVEEATALWDSPWHDLSVRELRMLVRDLPIDRTLLPAPIELLRRHELLEALERIQEIEL